MPWWNETENATQEPLRPLMTSCNSRLATVYEDKAKMNKEISANVKNPKMYISHGVLEMKQAV